MSAMQRNRGHVTREERSLTTLILDRMERHSSVVGSRLRESLPRLALEGVQEGGMNLKETLRFD